MSRLCVANTGQKVANWIGKHIGGLPARLGDTRDFATVGQLAETDTAQLKEAHVSMFTSAAPAAQDRTRRKFRRTV